MPLQQAPQREFAFAAPRKIVWQGGVLEASNTVRAMSTINRKFLPAQGPTPAATGADRPECLIDRIEHLQAQKDFPVVAAFTAPAPRSAGPHCCHPECGARHEGDFVPLWSLKSTETPSPCCLTACQRPDDQKGQLTATRNRCQKREKCHINKIF